MENYKVYKKDLLMPLEDFKCKEKSPIGCQTNMKDLVDFFLNTTSNVATITEGRELKGIISKNDMVVKFLYDFIHGQENELSNYLITKPLKLSNNSTILDSMMVMLRKEVTSIIIVKQDGGDYLKTLDYDDIFFWFFAQFEGYFKKLPVVKDWCFLDENILERNFKEIEKNTLDTSFFTNTLQKVLIRNNLNIDQNTSLAEFLEIAKEKRTSLASITAHESQLLGIVTPDDVLSFFKLNNFKPDINQPIKNVMNLNWFSLMKKHSLGLAIKNMVKRDLQYLVIMDEDRYPIGIARAFDILKLITDAVFYDETFEEGQPSEESA